MTSLIKYIFFSVFSLIYTSLHSTNYYPNGNGSFDNPDTWEGGSTYPQTGDDITFRWYPLPPASNTISLTNDYQVRNFNFSNCSPLEIILVSGDDSPHTLTINNLNIESDFTFVVSNNINLIVNGITNSNGGTIIIKEGAVVQFDKNVILSGAGANLTIEQNSLVDIAENLTFTGGVNNLDISGKLSMNDMIASGGAQKLNILPGGEVIIRNNSTFSGSATFDISNMGSFIVENDMTITGGSKGNIDGNLDVGNTLTSSVNLTGTGIVTAENYAGSGTLFGTPMNNLTDGLTYQTDGNGQAIPVNPLPIKLISFLVANQNNHIVLTWQTASEENNHYFTIERSVDGVLFETIGTVLGAGNSQTTLNYSFTDLSPLVGTTYYRLQQTDFDGKYEIFNMVSVSFYNEGDLKVFPNPASIDLTIDFGGLTAQSNIQIMNLHGQVVKTLSVWESVQTIDVSDLASGNYLLTIINENQPIVKHIVIQ